MARPGTFSGEVELGAKRFLRLRWYRKTLVAAGAIAFFAFTVPGALGLLLALAGLLALVSFVGAAAASQSPAPVVWSMESVPPPPPAPDARPIAFAGHPGEFARYCEHCGESFTDSTWICPQCGRLWDPKVPGNPVESLAWMLNELAQARRRRQISDISYTQLRGAYEARLQAARPAVAPTPAQEPAPVPHVAPVPQPAPAPVAVHHPTPVFTTPIPRAGSFGAPPAHPAPPPPPPRAAAPRPPAAPPRPPVDVNKVVREWAAKRQADLLLYLGAFLLTISAIIFVNYQGSIVGGGAKVGVLAGYTIGFLVMGMGLRRWDRVEEASPVFVAIGALLTPLNFVMLWVQLGGETMSLASVWLAGSATTSALYLFLAWRGFGRFYVGPAIIAALVAWGSLAATIHIPTEWYGAWFAATSTVAMALVTTRFQERRRILEAAAAVLGAPAVLWAIACAVLSGERDYARAELPVTLAIIIPGLLAEARRFRSLPAFALLPAFVAGTAGSAVWAARVPTFGEADWAAIWPMAAVAGYLAIAWLESKHAPAWATVAAIVGAASLVTAHALAGTGWDPHALPVTYALASLFACAAWLKWRWTFNAAILPPLLSLTVASALWSVDRFEFEWSGAAVVSASAGYLALVWLHPSRSGAWRVLALLTATAAVAAAHVAAAVPDTNGVQLATVYAAVFAGAAFDGAIGRFAGSWLIVPATAVGASVSTLWVLGVPQEQWPWPALAVAAAIGATEFAWRRSKLLESYGWGYAILLAAAPLLATRLFLDAPAIGAGAFGGSALIWLVASVRSRGTVGALAFGQPQRTFDVEQRALTYGAAAFGFVALGFTNRALGWDLPLAAWTYLGAGVACWLAAATLGRKVRSMNAILGPIGAASIGIAVASGLADWGQEAMMAGTAAGAAAVAIQRPYAQPWRFAMVVASATALVFAHGHALMQGDDAWQLPAAYGLVLASFLWDALVDRNDASWLAVPAAAGAGISTTTWFFGAPPEHWAWPGPGIALLIEATSPWWTRKRVLATVGWQYALLGALVPLAFVVLYLDVPVIGAAAFASGSLVWLVASVFSNGAISSASPDRTARRVEIERRVLAWGACALAFGSIAFVDDALGWSLPESAWSFAAAGIAAWLAAAGPGRKFAELNGIFGPVGTAGLTVATLLAAGYADQQALTLGGAAVAAGLAIQPRFANSWRAMMLISSGLALGFAHIAGATGGPGTWALPATYGFVLTALLWDAAFNRSSVSQLLIPAAVSSGGASLLFVLDVGPEQWAWPALGVALALVAGARWWQKSAALNWAGWAYALTLALAPALWLVPFRTHPAIGSATFATAATIWALVATLARDGIFPSPGREHRPVGERTVLGLGSAGLLFAADGYFAWAIGWSQSQASWSFAALAFIAWAATAAVRDRVAELNIILVVTALSATFVSVAAAHGHPGESSVLVTVSTVGSLAGCYGVGRWPMAYLTAAGSAIAAGFLWRFTGWETWSLALAYAGGAGLVSVAFTPLRTWQSGERSATAAALSILPWLLALGTAIVAAGNRSQELTVDQSLATTAEWAALTAIIVAIGSLIFIEGIRLKLPAVSISATAIMLLGVEFAIAMLEPSSAQAYTTPLGCYIVGLALYVRHSSELFGPHMLLHEALMFAGEAVIVLPGARDALASSDLRWSLLLIGEGLILLAIGFVLAQRWLVVGGVLTLVGVAGRFFTSGDYQPPYWLTLAIVGMVLLGGGVILLAAREWWDRTRERVTNWWFRGGPPRGQGGMSGPLPPVSHA